jgi:hypothetical protein
MVTARFTTARSCVAAKSHHVRGDDDGAVRSCEGCHLVVRRAGGSDVDDLIRVVLGASPEVVGGDGREHLVDEEPHVR